MNRQGEYVKKNIGNASYKSFKPSNLKDVVNTFERDVEMDDILIKIYENLAKIEKLSEYVKSTEFFLYSYIYKEALESSKIEGTICTMQDVLSEIYIKNKDTSNNIVFAKVKTKNQGNYHTRHFDNRLNRGAHNKKIDDIKEVISNISAIYFGVKKIKELPLCTRLYKEIHKELLKNVRGATKNPGELRSTQNWIGGKTIELAKFIPPNVHDMNEALNMFDEYINDDKIIIDKIINIALIHYQFETIHPFLDGNGRLGRIIILLYMIKVELIKEPIVYLSYYLKMNQSEYYEKLTKVREEGKYEEYVKFFLRCMKEATNDVVNKIEVLEKLHNTNIALLPTTKREKNTLRIVFDCIEKEPIFSIKSIMEHTNLAFNTINSNINTLKKLNIVSNYVETSRNQVFIYKKLFDIISS